MTSRPLQLALEASFEQLSATVPANVGIAIARPDRTYSLGRWSSGVAWSTIKVPLAIAALRRDRRLAQDLVVKAITESDNSASEQLWSQLGDPADAARQVQIIVQECGDAATVVESRRLRRGFTAFGQTQWTLDRQARFAAQLPVIPDGAAVIDLMRQLTSGQRLDTNSQWLSARLGELGVRVVYHTTVADDLAANVAVFRAAIERADIVVASGVVGLILQNVLPRRRFDDLPGETIYIQREVLASRPQPARSRGTRSRRRSGWARSSASPR